MASFLEEYFDENTMSIHLKSNSPVFAKRGHPGNWSLVRLTEADLDPEILNGYVNEIMSLTSLDGTSFIEKEQKGSTIIQYNDYRIIIVSPPLSNGLEITAVRQIKHFDINTYNLSEKLHGRLIENLSGVLVAGSPGHGKTTFVSSLGKFLSKKGKIIKTIESPRDLVLPPSVTQYSLNNNHSELRDIILLSRPDCVLLDEIRNPDDFRLFTDLRLSGVSLVGVIHSNNPLDAAQRFIGKLDLGLIPHVVDTIIFIQDGKINKILSLSLTVRTPTGMNDKDLARPIIEVKDFETEKLEFEIYKFGEESVIVPISYDHKSLMKFLFSKFGTDFKLKAEDNGLKIILPRYQEIESSLIDNVKRNYGFNLSIEFLKEDFTQVDYDLKNDNKYLIFQTDAPNKKISIVIDENPIFTILSSKNGEIKINKNLPIYEKLRLALANRQKVELRYFS